MVEVFEIFGMNLVFVFVFVDLLNKFFIFNFGVNIFCVFFVVFM